MLTERFLAVAQVGDQFILWLLVALSVISIALILERLVVLRSIGLQSGKIRDKIRIALGSQNYEIVEELGKDVTTLEGRALNYGLKHVKESGSKGLEELFNSLFLIALISWRHLI
jgi:biopolymer transport protein ExbB